MLGAGRVGRAVALELQVDNEVAVFDPSPAALASVNVAHKFTTSFFKQREIIKKTELVVSTLPGGVAFRTVARLLRLGKDVVDTSFMPEDPFELDHIARKNNVLYIPDAGYAPGLTNVIAGSLFGKGDNEIRIYVAGLPQHASEPFRHAVTFNAEGLIDEYLRPARIVRDGRIISIDPLSDISSITLNEIGALEAFYSDGLRTMLRTLKVRNMFERTLRYPGHLTLMRQLRDLGFFSSERLDGFVPRRLTERLFEHYKSNEDMCITVIEGRGSAWERYYGIDRSSAKGRLSSMSRMTGFSAASFARLVLKGEIEEKGVFPPEYVGLMQEIGSKFFSILKRHGIELKHENEVEPL